MSTAKAFSASLRRSPRVVIVTAVAFVVSAIVAIFFGTSWALAANDPSIALAVARDTALQQGSQEIVNFNTLDYRKVQQGLTLWANSSTGTLHTEVEQGRATNAARITQAKTTTTAQVLTAGINQLNTNAGNATMIAVVNVTVTPAGQQPVQKRFRYQAALTRVGTQWKLSSLGQVAVG
jgi:Mce-associated membrane protein